MASKSRPAPCRPHCSGSSHPTPEGLDETIAAPSDPTSERLWPSRRRWRPNLATNPEHSAAASGTLPTVRPGLAPDGCRETRVCAAGAGLATPGTQAVIERAAANARAVDSGRMSGCRPGIACRFAGMGRAARPPDDEGAISASANPHERMASEHQSKSKPAAPALPPAGLPGRDMAGCRFCGPPDH